MIRKSITTVITFGSVGCLLFVLLFANGIWAKSPGFMGSALHEISDILRDSSTQWMVVLCLACYFVMLLILERRVGSPKAGETPALPYRAPFRRNVFNPNLWLAALVLLVLSRYAFSYGAAVHSSQVPVLLAGIVLGKGVWAWTRWQNDEFESRVAWLIGLLVCLFAGGALWQPEATAVFRYHGIPRWNGAWDNPNLYGLLMAAGVVLAIGQIVQNLKSKVQSSRLENNRAKIGDGKWRKTLCVALCSFAAILCGYGLFKSYSRGAWFGAICGLAHLFAKSEIGNRKSEIAEPARFSCFSWLYRNRLSLSVVMLSVGILGFWQFRFSEWRPAQRIFSIANINDFSWRNRVAAWEGATRMMIDRPLMGFGWGQAEAAYGKDYSPPQLDASAAIEMNDYFMLGISAGVPALICFVVYIWLSLTGKTESRKLEAEIGDKRAARPALDFASPATRDLSLHVICRAGAIVLLVGFGFDGGLFKLSVGPIFWILMELSRPESGGTRHSVRAENQLPENIGAQGTDAPCQLEKWEIWLRRAAWVLATAALLQTTIYLGTPLLPVSNGTLAVARKCLIPPKTVADFDFLATNAIWRGKRLKVLLAHVNLANYDRELVNWQLDDKMYRDFVLSPVINGKPDEQLNWRRPLWEEFYPRIRHESSPADAANIVLRQLRERVTISTAANLPHDVPKIWAGRMTDASGFEIISVAALRSVGIPARLNDRGQAELFADGKWQLAPHPILGNPLKL